MTNRIITIETESFNSRRYSRPWIARVADWPAAGRPELEWGTWRGRDGSEGRLEVEAAPGDVVRWGQKDRRGNGTEALWGIVQADGSVEEVTEVEARDHYDRPQDDRAALEAEAEALRARLAEVEALLAA